MFIRVHLWLIPQQPVNFDSLLVRPVATFKLSNVNRKALELLLHRFFGNARLDLQLKDRFGGRVEPREWFLVPLPVIDEAIQRIKEGTIGGFRYGPETARLTPA